MDDISLVLSLGVTARSIGPTVTHHASSRSHAVFTIQPPTNDHQSESCDFAGMGPKLFLVDLAGRYNGTRSTMNTVISGR